MAAFRFSEQERRRAVNEARELIDSEGYSQTSACQAVADSFGLTSPRTIAMWAADFGERLPSGANSRAATERANAANVVFNQLARLDLSDKGFRKLQELLPRISEAGDMWKWSTAFRELVQMRRLEENKSTSANAFTVAGEQGSEPQTLDELATGRRPELRAIEGGVSPLARRTHSPSA